MDALSRIPWDQSIREEVVKAIFKATKEGPDALMDPTINQVVTWMGNKKLETVKVADEK